MNGNRVTLCLTALMIAVVLLSVTGSGTASPLELHLGGGAPTMVNYQGQVEVGHKPYDGTGYFKFAIWSGSGGNEWTNDGSATGGGEPTASVALAVDNGLFNVLLGDTSLTNMTALSASVFNGTERYLRIWFSSDNTTFILLSPDQRIAAVPYALQAEKVKGYANVLVVAKSGGDYTTISEALASITTASDSNRYLIKVMPGVYSERVVMKEYVDIEGSGELNTRITHTGSSTAHQGTLHGANNAELRSLTVENTGGDEWAIAIYNASASPRFTQVNASASGGKESFGVYNYSSSSPVMVDVSVSASGSGIVVGVVNEDSSSPVMRDVTASALGGTYSDSTGIINYSSSPSMTDVSATASGDWENCGVENNSSSPVMTRVSASASGGNNNTGVINKLSSPVMTDVTASASGGEDSDNHGVFNYHSSPVMTDVSATASGGGGGGSYSMGVYNENSSPVMTGLSASASGGDINWGVCNQSSTAIIRSSIISASGTTNDNIGIYNTAEDGSYTVNVDSSQITASTNTIRNDSEFTTLIGASLLSGGTVTGAGTLTCAGVYDEDYDFFANKCSP